MKLLGMEISSAEDLRVIRENYADLERIVEDIGWIRINDRGQDSQEAVGQSFEQMVKRSRLAFIKNPIIAQAINLTTNYTFGEGVAEPKCAEGNDEVQSVVSEFWTAPDNRLSFTDTQAQLKISNKLQYDGELAFALKVDTDGLVYVRYFDPISIVKVIHDPSDSLRPLFYKRSLNMKDQYIPDYANGLAHLRKNSLYKAEWEALLEELQIREDQVPESIFCYHVKINNDILDTRGVPEVYRALDWMNANSRINSDMSLFINTQAQFAWKKKFKGTKAQMQAAKARTGQNTNLTNPARGAGSAIFENEKITNEAIALPNSSGELFEIGIRRTLLMTVAAFGMMEHYFGDPSTGNLATAEAMELPMLKKFLARQKVWEDIYLNILNFQLDMRLFAVSEKFFEYNPMMNRITVRKGQDYADRYIDVDFPPILEKNIKALAEALTSAKSGQLVPIETAQRMFMQGIGVNNIDEEMKKEFAEQIAPLLSAFGQQDPAKQQEGARLLRDFLNGVHKRGRPVREASIVRSQPGELEKAGKLAEKNRQVFRQMNAYLREIARVYNIFARGVRDGVKANVGADGKWSGVVHGLEGAAARFEDGMIAAADRFFPKAAMLGASYAEARVAVKEAREAKLVGRGQIEDFLDEQFDWNRGFVEELAPALTETIRRKIRGQKFDTREEFDAAIEAAIKAPESRVGMYAGAFWTVEERAVKKFSEGSGVKANFVGVDDDKVCEGCRVAIDGSPWPIESAPVPGEQDCLGNCRHALQLEGDDALQESDIALMRESEAAARGGFSLLTDAQEAFV